MAPLADRYLNLSSHRDVNACHKRVPWSPTASQASWNAVGRVGTYADGYGHSKNLCLHDVTIREALAVLTHQQNKYRGHCLWASHFHIEPLTVVRHAIKAVVQANTIGHHDETTAAAVGLRRTQSRSTHDPRGARHRATYRESLRHKSRGSLELASRSGGTRAHRRAIAGDSATPHPTRSLSATVARQHEAVAQQ